jgi:DNA-binding NtrC family response regulator
MFLRPCFLVVDREFAGSISSRKLVIETAKFNVITAYSIAEAEATVERYPRLDGIVVSAGNDDAVIEFLKRIRAAHPKIKLVLTGHAVHDNAPCDAHVESYAPDRLLSALRKLFPDDSAKVEQIEKKLEDDAEKP